MAGMFSFEAKAESNRIDFARAMGRLSPGMSAEQVVAILGKPDDVRTQYDPGGISAARTTEIWAYGTDGHLSFPTLGCVYMDKDKVQYIYGGKGTPPDPTMFNETDLKSILRQINKASTNNPRSLIQTVNRLQPLGKDKALAALSEFLRVADGFTTGQRTELFLVLRLLFDVPEDPGYMPPMRVGGPNPENFQDPKLLPRYPLVLIDDIPLYLIWGYMLAGFPQPVEEHIEYFRKYGKLRDHPLQPSDDPLAVLAKYEQSPQWIYRRAHNGFTEDSGREYLANQLLQLVDSVYRLKPNQDGTWFEGEHFDQSRWDGVVKDFAALHVKWNPTQNIYVFADGTSLPEITKPSYRRCIWDLPELGPESNLIIERTDKDHIKMELRHAYGGGHPSASSVVTVYRLDENKKQIAQFKLRAFPGTNISGSESYYRGADLTEGITVQAEFVYEGKTTVSPVFTP